MKSMNTPDQPLDGAAKASGRLRGGKASISMPSSARESRSSNQSSPSRSSANKLANTAAANDSRPPLALLEDLHESTSAAIDAAGRHSLIAEAAYLRAERRGFSGGCCETDWLEAEREVDGQLVGRGLEGARYGG